MQIGENKARFLMTNFEAMEIVVNVGLQGELSPNTVTTSHMGRIYQWFVCPEGSTKGGPTENMFKIRPRGKYAHERFPFVPFALRRFRHYKKEKLANSKESGGFFKEFMRCLTEKRGGTSSRRSEEISEWKRIKERLQKKRLRLLCEKGYGDALVYDISPSLSSSTHSDEVVDEKTDGDLKRGSLNPKTAGELEPHMATSGETSEQRSNLCKEMINREEALVNVQDHSFQENTDKDNACAERIFGPGEGEHLNERRLAEGVENQQDNTSEEASGTLSSGMKARDRDGVHHKMKTEQPESEVRRGLPLSPTIDEPSSRKENFSSSSSVRLHPRRSIRRLESSSSDLVSLDVDANQPVHRYRRSAVFLANLASRMTHLKNGVKDEPTCECNAGKGSCEGIEFDRCLSSFFRNSKNRDFRSDRYWSSDRRSNRKEDTSLFLGDSDKSKIPKVSQRRLSVSCSGEERSVLTCNGLQKNQKTNDHLPHALPLGANIPRGKHLAKSLNQIYLPKAQSIAGVLTRGFKNGRTVETFLFNPHWPSKSESEKRPSPETCNRAIPPGICTPPGNINQFKLLGRDSTVKDSVDKICRWVGRVDDGKSMDVARSLHQSLVIAKCCDRIHLNKNSNNDRRTYDYCDRSTRKNAAPEKRRDPTHVKKNRRSNLLYTERILIHPIWRCQRTCKTDVVGCSHQRARN